MKLSEFKLDPSKLFTIQLRQVRVTVQFSCNGSDNNITTWDASWEKLSVATLK